MATASMPRVGDEIKLGPEPQVFAVRFLEGKAVASRYPGGRNMFSTPDGQKMFLNDEDTSEFEHAMLEAGVRAGEQMAVSRVSHGRGGGFSIRVKRVESDTEGLLRRSVAIAQQSRRETTAETVIPPQHHQLNKEAVQAPQPNSNPGLAPASAKLCSSFMAAIDAVTEAQAYADRRGLKITFTSEDVRSTAISCYITACREGGR